MKMIELLGGIVIGGVAGVALKEKLLGTQDLNTNKQQELNSLFAENEKFSKRNKELERQVEDLLSELNKVRKKAQNADDDHDDIQDELDRAKKDLKSNPAPDPIKTIIITKSNKVVLVKLILIPIIIEAIINIAPKIEIIFARIDFGL